MREHKRCVICNKVNDPSIATNAGDYIRVNKHHSTFVSDYKFPDSFICFECDNVIQETLMEYHFQDLDKELEELAQSLGK